VDAVILARSKIDRALLMAELRTIRPMPFVVRVDFIPMAQVRWLTVPRLGAMRAFAPRDMAAVFETLESAQFAADELLGSVQADGATFTIEEAD
jgi:hypothetical protein